MNCQHCENCIKDIDSEIICLEADRDCYEGCDYCQTHNNCKYE